MQLAITNKTINTQAVKAQLVKADIIKKISIFVAILACVVTAINM
jgi:hypothetical protein